MSNINPVWSLNDRSIKITKIMFFLIDKDNKNIHIITKNKSEFKKCKLWQKIKYGEENKSAVL